MKNNTNLYNFFKNVIYLLLFLTSYLFHSELFAQNKKIEILQSTRQFVQEEAKESINYNLFLKDIDSLIFNKDISEEVFTRAVLNAGDIFRIEGKLTMAIELFMNVISAYEQAKELTPQQTETLIKIYIPLGAAHEELGMWNRAMEFYLKALSLAEELDLENPVAMVYNNICAIHFSRGEIDKAEEYILKALEINNRNNNKRELFINYNNLAGIYWQRNDFNKAINYALLAIQQLNSEVDPYLYYSMQTNLAGLYLVNQDYKLAITYLRNAMRHQLEHNFNSDLVQTYSLLSKSYDGIGSKDSAFIYIHKALEKAQMLNNKKIETRAYNDMATYYERNKNFEKAYEALRKAKHLEDSLSHINNQQKIQDMEMIYDAEKKIRENEIVIKDITLQKLASDRLWIITAFIALFLVFAILYLINRSRNKEKERLTKELLNQQQKELYEKEKEIQQQKEQELSYILDKRNRELTSYTLYMIKTNEFVSDLNEELKQLLLELNPKDRQHREHVKQILNKLHQQNHANNWEEFRYYFEQVHPAFYEELEKAYPDLTLKEKRLCAFLRLGLSSKDISAITFKEVRSVESARNRLRKKLGISPEGNLTEFLTTFSR